MGCYFPVGILGQVWCLIVLIPDLCPLSYFHGFREEEFLTLSYYKSMGAIALRGEASLNPRGMISRIYIRDH